MGKSPGKWIKSLILGKKSSKSKLSRENDVSKSADKGEVLISSEAPVTDTTVEHSTISQLAPAIGARSGADSEHVAAANLQNEGLQNEIFTFSFAQRDENAEEGTKVGSEEDPERIRHETAITKAQAAVRGYLARRAFRTLKGIIRLQALIRGHLVRRQAIATLHCLHAIVKFQALVRGQKVRCSTVGIEVQKACNIGKVQGAICSDSSGIPASTPLEKLMKNVFVQKLLASLPGEIPLSVHYSSVEPNSSWEWLERWTRSHCQESQLQPKINSEYVGVKKVESEQRKQKRSVRKVPRANSENSSGRSTKVSERPKHNPRKLPSHPMDLVQEHPQNEFEKVNRNVRKASDSTKDARERLVDSGKPKRNMKSSTAATPEVSESANGMAEVVMKESDDDTSPKHIAVAGALQEHHDLDLQPMSNNSKVRDAQGTIKQSNPKDYHTGNENQKISDRRASFPPNIENQENGIHNTPKVPSYMAPTESARAKLRGQGSPRFSQDAIENIGTTRRHSLPTSTSGKFPSMSPRVQKLVHSAGKGVTRSDVSLSSSRDDTDKVIKAEWRR
ncbi:protein IQ-DOMAIN 29 isoform X3 [Manihot esculenta]|uniref:protein IQ-DOMAIN 29 isoform X3 n=1 Tax=Manihot esculenta TaxID=3983 RepID=UPI001CC72ABF|nr:protein IQ-DOMAIN 29 isoform X3 [Manihot esculenta]